jgi:hypothetical protein
MATTSLPSDLNVQGRLTVQSIVLPAATVTNASVATDAAIAASKLGHRVFRGHAQNGTAASVTVPIHVATAAGTIVSLKAGVIGAAVGAATVTVNLLKGNATVLGGVTTIDSSTAARTAIDGTITTPAYVAGAFFELVITATAGGGTLPTGLIVEVAFDESPA